MCVLRNGEHFHAVGQVGRACATKKPLRHIMLHSLLFLLSLPTPDDAVLLPLPIPAPLQ